MRSINRLLVANRGEIARRVMRSAHAMGISTVAVYSAADREAPHVRDADLAVALGGYSAAESYLDAQKLLKAARHAGADAVHPGYGFLSENADFAQACIDAGLVWVGPLPAAMRAMGDKVAARRVASEAGVPVLPGGIIGPQPWRERAVDVGLPLLVKATAGGGGRGMRLVSQLEELDDAIVSAQREAEAAFGDPTVFLERCVSDARHVEVQVFGDSYGNVIHLYERECSIQRRRQKLIEEAPAPNLPESTRAVLRAAALKLAAAIGYENAGTVEFLVDADGVVWFLEMNTRLQVEQPVTEAVTGLDLVRLQLLAAMGEPLGLQQTDVHLTGSAVEARLYAEDPAHDFLPSAGRLHRFEPGLRPGLRYDAGVESGSEISPFYDGLLAKVIAHAPTRTEALAQLARGLRELQVHGPRTNRDCLAAVLESDAFRLGDVSTEFLTRHPEVLSAAAPPDVLRLHALAAALVLRARRRIDARVLRFTPGGWRNVAAARQSTTFQVDGETINIAYAVADDDSMCAAVDGVEMLGSIRGVARNSIDLEVAGLRATYAVHSANDAHYVNSPSWQTRVDGLPRFGSPEVAGEAAGPSAPLPGTVVAIMVRPGERVQAGQTLVVLDAMKIEHHVLADIEATVVEVRVAPGDRVDAHQVLMVLEA
jgi:propionyl-CoA carboxylase alpha chain